MARIKYYNTTTQQWEYADGIGGNGGISGDAKAIGRACYNLLDKAEYTADIAALKAALWELVGANLVSISAEFSQDETPVYPTTSLDSLKSMLIVTASYDDGTTTVVADYALSGTLAIGTSTITVTYKGKTTTFDVVVSEAPELVSITAVFTQGTKVVYPTTILDSLKNKLVVTALFDNDTTEVVDDYELSGNLTVGTSTVTVTYNEKTATFNVTVAEGETLPDGYSQLEYLKGDGAAYINTNIHPTENTNSESKVEIVSASKSAGIVSVMDENASNVPTFGFNTSTKGTALYFRFGGQFVKIGGTPVTNTPIILKNVANVANDEYTVTGALAQFTCVQPLYLFATNRGGEAYNIFDGRIYYSKIYDGDTLEHHFVPVIQTSTGKYGMYDIVGNAFCGNSGSGTFTGV